MPAHTLDIKQSREGQSDAVCSSNKAIALALSVWQCVMDYTAEVQADKSIMSAQSCLRHTCHSRASLLDVCTIFEGMPCSFSAGRVANRCTMVSGSSRSLTASTKDGYLQIHKSNFAPFSIACEAERLFRGRGTNNQDHPAMVGKELRAGWHP